MGGQVKINATIRVLNQYNEGSCGGEIEVGHFCSHPATVQQP
jgi:hypothetical protein